MLRNPQSQGEHDGTSKYDAVGESHFDGPVKATRFTDPWESTSTTSTGPCFCRGAEPGLRCVRWVLPESKRIIQRGKIVIGGANFWLNLWVIQYPRLWESKFRAFKTLINGSWRCYVMRKDLGEPAAAAIMSLRPFFWYMWMATLLGNNWKTPNTVIFKWQLWSFSSLPSFQERFYTKWRRQHPYLVNWRLPLYQVLAHLWRISSIQRWSGLEQNGKRALELQMEVPVCTACQNLTWMWRYPSL